MEFIKQKAWDFFAAIAANEFPFDALSLNKKYLGFKIAAYSNSQEYIKAKKLEKYAQRYDGFAVKDENGALIFYSDSLSYAERNKVIMHEVAHVVLGHTTYNNILGHSPNPSVQNKQEEEATLFALSFLAPAPALWHMRVSDPVKIARLTGLSVEDSRFIADEVLREGRQLQEQKAAKVKMSILAALLIAVLSLGIWVAYGCTKAPLPPPLETQTENLTAIVYITASGEKYHLQECRYVKNKGIPLTVEKAKKEGYAPCKVCKPS